MQFTDRRSAKPGRCLVTPEDGGTPFYATIKREDNPIEPGTPLNAATFNGMIRGMAARNLLDNSNFYAPVNQRGGDMYVGVSQYTIDRWRVTSKLDLFVEDGHIRLACSASATERNGFSQRIAPEKSPKPGTIVTATCEDTDGNIIMGTAEIPESGSVYIGQISDVGFRITRSAQDGVLISLMIPPGIQFAIKWMALYSGEFTLKTLPEYRAREFSAELMECMRYYQIRSAGNVPAMDLRPTMRVKPIVTQLEDGGYAYSADL